MSKVREVIETALKKHDCTRSEVSEAIGMTRQQFTNMMKRRSRVPVKYFWKLTGRLFIPSQELMEAYVDDYREELRAEIAKIKD